MLKIGSAWARTCVRPASPCFAMVMFKNSSQNGSRPPPNVLCFVSSLVGVQVRQSGCIRNIFVPRKHHRKSRKYHGNTTENHGKSRKITENHGKSRKITEGFFQANHGNSRIPASLEECRQSTTVCIAARTFEWKVVPMGVKVGPLERLVSCCVGRRKPL